MKINLYANKKLTDLRGLEMLAQVGGDFNMYDNERLSDINALERLVQVEGDFFVIDNTNLITEQIRLLSDRVTPNKVTIADNKD